MFSRLGLLVVDVDLKTETELAAVGVGAADGTPCLVSALPATRGISCAPEGVQPFQQGVSIRRLCTCLDCTWKRKNDSSILYITIFLLILMNKRVSKENNFLLFGLFLLAQPNLVP